VEIVIESSEQSEHVVDRAVFSEKRVTGRVECQRDDEIPQSDVQSVVLVRSFLKILVD
jgi:hypothetical protein